jgi:methylase of polypeptide subunit release factors
VLPDNNNQTPYAIVKLEEAARTVKQAVNEFTSLRKKLDKVKNDKTKAQEVYADLQQQFTRLKNALETSTLALLEMELSDMADYSAKLARAVKGFNLMTSDYGKLCAALSDYLAKLPLSDTKAKTTNAAVIGRLMATVKMGYYPTDMEHLKYITRGIEFPKGITVNLLDPCCGCGLALQTLAREHECNTFGVELDRHRAEEAITRLNRVGFGSYFHSRISQEAFHLMLLNPPYLSVMTEGGSNARSEKRFLIDCYSHLMYGGLLIYIIPYYRLTVDICRVLCDNFEDLTVWKFMGGEFKKFKQIAVMGLRCKRRDGSKMVQELASLVLKPDTLRELSELPEGRYRLPETAVKVNTFKGAQFNVYEMAEQLKRSASFSKLFEKNKLDSTCKRPLLPLNIGQVGLIGGSGLINGLVECDTPHIIKGRVVKEIVVGKEGNLNSKGDLVSTTVTETRSNKMIFNLLTPQGFISLSDYGNQDIDDGMSATA